MDFEGMFRVKPESKVRLNHHDPASKDGHGSIRSSVILPGCHPCYLLGKCQEIEAAVG
jgi:hypothetical protein